MTKTACLVIVITRHGRWIARSFANVALVRATTFQREIASLKRVLIAVSLLIATVVAGAGEVLQNVNVSKQDASRELIWSLSAGQVSYEPVRRAFKAAAAPVKVAMVEQAFAWTKAYVSSPEFAKAYAAARNEAKPQTPESAGSVDAELKRRRAERQEQLAESKRALAEIPAEYRKEAAAAMKESEAAIKRMDSDPEMVRMEREQIQAELGDQQENYKQELERWNEEYPANPRALVAKRLREFLAESEGVAYDAKLVRRGNKMVFANEAYESKSDEWKKCFRAGKEPVEKARALAKAWLGELK